MPPPVEGELAEFAGATAWLNSEQLTPVGLRGKVVLVQFCTYSCINWLRTLPYVRAWAERYENHGLVIIGAHSPEFPFEHDVDRVRGATRGMGINYPIALDNDFAIWRALGNQYWPALYLADAEGRLRYHHFGEGAYERTEEVVQELLAEAGFSGIDQGTAAVQPSGIEIAADFDTLGSPETYVGYARTQGFASPGGLKFDQNHVYEEASNLQVNEWSLSGDWTVERQTTTLNEAGGRIAYRFQARDLNLVLGPSASGDAVPFRIRIDGEPPGPAHGLDIDDEGNGTVSEARLYQLIRHPGPVTERLFEITFLDGGAQAYVFTFG